MSANNYVLVTAKNDVMVVDVDTGHHGFVRQFDNLEDAVEYAQELSDEGVEYGITFEPRREEPE